MVDEKELNSATASLAKTTLKSEAISTLTTPKILFEMTSQDLNDDKYIKRNTDDSSTEITNLVSIPVTPSTLASSNSPIPFLNATSISSTSNSYINQLTNETDNNLKFKNTTKIVDIKTDPGSLKPLEIATFPPTISTMRAPNTTTFKQTTPIPTTTIKTTNLPITSLSSTTSPVIHLSTSSTTPKINPTSNNFEQNTSQTKLLSIPITTAKTTMRTIPSQEITARGIFKDSSYESSTTHEGIAATTLKLTSSTSKLEENFKKELELNSTSKVNENSFKRSTDSPSPKENVINKNPRLLSTTETSTSTSSTNITPTSTKIEPISIPTGKNTASLSPAAAATSTNGNAKQTSTEDPIRFLQEFAAVNNLVIINIFIRRK